jgi:hypothetical protein
MSLFVIFESKNAVTGVQNSLERWVPFTSANLPKLVGERIDYIQADGDELDVILGSFENLPVARKKKIFRWYGDLAMTIYNNLHNL